MEHGFAGRHVANEAVGADDQSSTEIPDLDETLAQKTGRAAPNIVPPPPKQLTFDGIRTGRYSYMQLVEGTLQVYDLQRDPFQHVNIATSAHPAVLNQLGRWLDSLRGCAGQGCRMAENAPPQ